MDQLRGYIERITYQNPENGYTVAQLKLPGKESLVCIVGTMPSVRPGETVRCTGNWKQHPVHGRQFEVQECRVEAPADIVGITKYLGSGLIKGIGSGYATRIVKCFGIHTLEIIDKTPDRLLEVPGLGQKRMEKIRDCWSEQKAIRDVMIFLQSHNVSPTYAQKIFKKYGDNSIRKVQENPYALSRDIFGIGFKTADAIAQKLGVSQNAVERIDAGIEYVLYELMGDGHVCYPVPSFIGEAGKILDVSVSAVEERLSVLSKDSRIEVMELTYQGKLEKFIWLKSLFSAENGIARELMRLKKSPAATRQVDVKSAIDWVQKTLNIKLADQQKEAVGLSLTDKVLIITGGPGTGKSTITKAILAISEKVTSQILLAAPTGRAAKRMSEITGRKASTIHSLLAYDFRSGGFKHDRNNPLQCDLIIIDEASMIDTYLMFNLLKAIPDRARVVFVGDIDQLPSVGPGNVLRDMIDSQMIPLAKLTEIFRQAAGSLIITNAHRINHGVLPEVRNHNGSDFFFLEEPDPEKIATTVTALVQERLPKRYGFDPIQDIQVLAPMRRGVIGTENLNTLLQKKLNNRDEGVLSRGTKLCVHDKVMQVRNNYQKGVYNGDIGRIVSIDPEDQNLVVLFDDRKVEYEFSELDELVLSYAVSVHKYQGSECPCLVMPLHTTHFKLLTRNLLYTAVTRGKRLVVLVGTTKACAIAIHNNDVQRRYTGLNQALMATLNPHMQPFLGDK